MTDYSELVKALRCKSLSKECDSCGYGYRLCSDSECNDACHVEQIIDDAADAIEALQAAEPTEKQVVDYCHKRCLVVLEADLFHELKASYGKMPKRGNWVEDTTTHAGPGLSNYKCSLCGKICGTWRRGLKPSELPNWCGNCGADMRKMEVQE